MENIKVVLLGVTAYDFEDDRGKRVSGCNVWFSEVDSVLNETTKGFIPKKVNMDHKAFAFYSMNEFPVYAEAILVTNFTNRGVMTKIKDFKVLPTPVAKSPVKP